MPLRLMFHSFVGLMAGGLALLVGGVGDAPAGNEMQKLTAPDTAQGDFFGWEGLLERPPHGKFYKKAIS